MGASASVTPWAVKRLCYLIGVPGAGKSTAMAAVLEPWTAPGVVGAEEHRLPFAHRVLPHPLMFTVVELGRQREGGFPGTDSLSMAVQPRVVKWLAECQYEVVVGEGDRLGNIGFLDTAHRLGWEVRLAVLACLPEVAAERRRLRGSDQSVPWLLSRQTKVFNVVKWASSQPHIRTAIVNASRPREEIADVLRDHFFRAPREEFLLHTTKGEDHAAAG